MRQADIARRLANMAKAPRCGYGDTLHLAEWT
jgi:hypothetical protein